MTRLYVVPNPSSANAHFRLADQVVWYDRLAEFLQELRWLEALRFPWR